MCCFSLILRVVLTWDFGTRDAGLFRLASRVSQSRVLLSDDHFLRLHAVAIHKAQHVDARGLVEADVDVAIDGLAADHAASDVDHLQSGFAIIVDHPFATVEVGERFDVVLIHVVAGGVDEFEAVGIVGRAGCEGVARVGQQVDIGASKVVDEVEVFHLDVLSVDAEGVGTVLGSVEADGSGVLVDAAHHGKLFFTFVDVKLGTVVSNLEFRQSMILVETHYCTVDDSAFVIVKVDNDTVFNASGFSFSSR